MGPRQLPGCLCSQWLVGLSSQLSALSCPMKGPVGTGLLGCSQPESKPIWAEKSNLFSLSCQKDMRCLVNFSSSSIFFSVSFSFFSSKLFQVCRGRVVFCGGKVPCWRVWCKPGEFGASWKVGGGGLVQTRLRPSSLTRQGCIVLVQASLRLSCCLPEQSVKLQHHSCHCSYHS